MRIGIMSFAHHHAEAYIHNVRMQYYDRHNDTGGQQREFNEHKPT